MNKTTQEILSRRAPESSGIYTDEIQDGVVLFVKDAAGVESHAVTVNEENRAFAFGRVQITAPGKNTYRVREWRESLYMDAIQELQERSGRYREPSVLMILGDDKSLTTEHLKAAARHGAGLVVIGERDPELFAAYEQVMRIEYLPANTAPPHHKYDFVVFDGREIAGATGDIQSK